MTARIIQFPTCRAPGDDELPAYRSDAIKEHYSYRTHDGYEKHADAIPYFDALAKVVRADGESANNFPLRQARVCIRHLQMSRRR